MKEIVKTRAFADSESTTGPTWRGTADALHEHLRPLIRVWWSNWCERSSKRSCRRARMRAARTASGEGIGRRRASAR